MISTVQRTEPRPLSLLDIYIVILGGGLTARCPGAHFAMSGGRPSQLAGESSPLSYPDHAGWIASRGGVHHDGGHDDE